MNARMSEEEWREAKIGELKEKNAAYTKALIAKGDPKTIHDVGNDVGDYLAFAQDDRGARDGVAGGASGEHLSPRC